MYDGNEIANCHSSMFGRKCLEGFGRGRHVRVRDANLRYGRRGPLSQPFRQGTDRFRAASRLASEIIKMLLITRRKMFKDEKLDRPQWGRSICRQ